MLRGISAVVKHYESMEFSGSLRFSVSEKDGQQNIDLCEDTTINGSVSALPMVSLPEVVSRLNYGWIIVYLEKGHSIGFDYKINYQGASYRQLERECKLKCSDAKIVVRKLNS